MKASKKKALFLAAVTLIVLTGQACKKEKPENEISEKAVVDKEIVYDSSKNFAENVELINSIIEKDYKKSFELVTVEEYEKGDTSDWMLNHSV